MAENKTAGIQTILVTGDTICDHNYYKGERPTADSDKLRGIRYAKVGGGALLLKGLISKTMEDDKNWTTIFGLDDDFKTLPLAYHSLCFWEPQAGNLDDDPKKDTLFWRAVEPPFGYGHKTAQLHIEETSKFRTEAYLPSKTPLSGPADIVVIDDAGIGFRDIAHKELWPFVTEGGNMHCPGWVVMKLTGSIQETSLLMEIVKHCKDNLVLIVPAEELRRRDVRLSRGLSWEATAEDLMAELHGNPLLQPLLAARHLIVTFQSDGAFWLDNKKGSPSSLLVFDAPRAEGEWSESQGKGGGFGFLSCFTAAIVRELCRAQGGKDPDLETALCAGLGASRELRRLGHGQVVIDDKEPEPGFPFAEISGKIQMPSQKFVSALIPQDDRVRGAWMMLDEWQVNARRTTDPRPHFEAALAVAVLGPEALERFPVARFGGYQTVDRKEIESLRTIRQLINNYRKEARPKTPLNLGVFGPPGSGKSYVVIEIAKAVLNIKNEDVLLFNLSQFSEVADLFGAFHQVRDKVLSGVTPLVFWDEFDSQGYRWLQYMLAPMEDGEFQEGQITHKIGKSIFVFAGATSATYAKFGPRNPDIPSDDLADDPANWKPEQLIEVEKQWRDFVLKKGPDFKSRLVGYLNILGVNCRQKCVEKEGRRRWEDDLSDLCYPIRRALFMRTLFKVEEGERLKLDPSVLRALLEMPRFKSGGRSLQFLCTHLRQNSSGTLSRSSLPGYELLNMHVDADLFWKLCEQDMGFVPKARELAQLLHEAYRLRIKDRPEKKKLDVPFAELSKDLQLTNIAQALRIPGILRLVNMHLEDGPVVPFKDLLVARQATEKPLRKLLADKNNLELLAEAEHNGWMVERMLNGWKYGQKKDEENKEKLHDCLIPYSQLTEAIKDFDRLTIIGKLPPPDKPNEEQFGYVDIVKTVGLRIVKDEDS